LSGYFEKVIRLIPPGIASGLLAGILLQFGIGAFGGASVDPVLVGLLILAYVLLKRISARYAVVGILVVGFVFLLLQDRVDLSGLQLKFAMPIFTMPEFTLNAALSVALPLFLITLTGQYMPGICFTLSGRLTPTCLPAFQAGRPLAVGSYCEIPIHFSH